MQPLAGQCEGAPRRGAVGVASPDQDEHGGSGREAKASKGRGSRHDAHGSRGGAAEDQHSRRQPQQQQPQQPPQALHSRLPWVNAAPHGAQAQGVGRIRNAPGEVIAHAVIDAPARQNHFRVIAEHFRLPRVESDFPVERIHFPPGHISALHCKR